MLVIILIVLIVVPLLMAIGIYNKLVRLKNRFKNAFSQIDVQLKRRYDLIPNLVEVSKKYMEHERETLEAVISARNQASSIAKQAMDQIGNPEVLKNLAAAEQSLGSGLGRLFAVMEQYPDLKANESMQQLSEELSSTENRISFARQAYNDSVMAYNVAREVFPNSIIANMMSFLPVSQLKIADKEKENPQIKF